MAHNEYANERPEGLASRGPSLALMLAEFDSRGRLMHAAEKVRDAGTSSSDAHTPFPIHGMDRAMGLRTRSSGGSSSPAASAGRPLAWLMMHWMNGVDYPLIVGGKPPGPDAPVDGPDHVRGHGALLGVRRGASACSA